MAGGGTARAMDQGGTSIQEVAMFAFATLALAAVSLATPAHAAVKPEGCNGHWFSYTGPGGIENTQCCDGQTTQECKDDCDGIVDPLGKGWECSYHDKLTVGGDSPLDATDVPEGGLFSVELTCEGSCVLIGVDGEIWTDSPFLGFATSAVFDPGVHVVEGATSEPVLLLQAL